MKKSLIGILAIPQIKRARDLSHPRIAIYRDITRRRRLESLRRHLKQLENLTVEKTIELQETRERFRCITERSFDAIVLLDLKGRITYVSSAIRSITGYPSEEIIGKYLQSYLLEEEIPRGFQSFVVAAKGGIACDLQSKIRRKDGSLGRIQANVSPVIKKGKISEVQVIIRDITERHKIAEVKDQFISAATDELLTPLTSIKGYLDLIISGKLGSVSKEVESSLQIARRNTDRLMRAIDGLLDILRLEAESLQLNFEPLDLRDMMDQCAIDIYPFINEKKQSLSLDIQEAAFPIRGDAARLSLALTNLLEYVIKFTSGGDIVTLRARNEGDRIRIEVSNMCIGVKREALERVFEPFEVFEKTAYVKDTGLGLIVAKRLVEAHGGKIWVSSNEESMGTTFAFTLPKQKEAETGQSAR